MKATTLKRLKLLSILSFVNRISILKKIFFRRWILAKSHVKNDVLLQDDAQFCKWQALWILQTLIKKKPAKWKHSAADSLMSVKLKRERENETNNTKEENSRLNSSK